MAECVVTTAIAKMTRKMMHLATVRGSDDKASDVIFDATGYGVTTEQRNDGVRVDATM